MEVKINREIRNYTESIFFGLSFRQFFFSLCACVIAAVSYFIFTPIFNKEIVSWICVLSALPFAGLGFFKYHGMFLEDFLFAFIKSKILISGELKFKSENIYYELIKGKEEK